MLFRQIFDPKLAQYAYLVGCQQTKDALIIDPERDIDRYVALAESEGVKIVAVAETHIHADFLSGAREFAERHGTRLYLSDEGDENWKYEWLKNGQYSHTLLKNGDAFRIGNIEIAAVHTPGHTPEHLSFTITDRGGGATEPIGIVTGDFVFVGDLGRPDLLESAAKVKGMMEPSARRLFASTKGFLELADYMQVWPGHGAGSACGKSLGAVPETTVGYEKRFNRALGTAAEGEDAFVRYILEGQPEPPLYFARMKRDNKLGPPLLGELPKPHRLEVAELAEVAGRTDALIIDTRLDRAAWAERHIPGSLYAPVNKAFNTTVGSLVEDEATLIFLIIEEADVEEAVRDLVRIGYDNLAGFADAATLQRYFDGGGSSASIGRISFAELDEARKREGRRVLDVRYASEYAGGHVEGAVNLSYTRLPENVEAVPTADLLIHCETGARASAAASYLERLGRKVTIVDGEFSEYAAGTAEASPAIMA